MVKTLAKKSARLLCAALLCCVLLGAVTGTARAVSSVTAQLRPDITIIIDGTQRDFYNAGGQEVHPILYNGTTYLPVRAIGELMGKNVDWNQSTKTVTLSGARTTPATAGTPDTFARTSDVAAEIRDDFTVVVDGATRSFADAGGNRVYPLLYAGSTYLPIRAIGELMGKTVSWDGTTKTVTLGESLVTDADSFSGNTTPGTSATPGGAVSLEDAKAAALTHAGVAASDATFTKQKLDRDDGRTIYEIEFYTSTGAEYEYDIDAATGKVLKFESDLEHAGTSGGSLITRERAQEIALALVPGATAANITKLELDRDDGRTIYEIEIYYNWVEYEYEIDAVSGNVLKSEMDRD